MGPDEMRDTSDVSGARSAREDLESLGAMGAMGAMNGIGGIGGWFAERESSPREELANCVSHGLGLLGAFVATPFLLDAARPRGPWSLAGATVFAVSVIVLYLASTLYHAAVAPATRRRLQRLDHAAIFVLIAGTYTPFLLGALRGMLGWALLFVVWTIAVAGMTLKACGRLTRRGPSLAMYLALGWLAVVAIRPFALAVPVPGLLLLVAGGLAYTTGVAFFALERLRYGHLVWHLCVLAGTGCHFAAVLWYAR
ncbi:MAG TPA: hemolysin III family protein [Gemmatimonadales bacterium]|nr:hemolysin III family protein [Gemmatimonadales bacterium]